MAQPGVPGGPAHELDLPCGATVDVHRIDLGLRELECDCGARHGVVTDAHPLGRFLPEFLGDVLRETVESADDFEAFSMPHLMGMVLEEYPEAVAAADVSDDGQVGYAMIWVTDFDARRLHEVVVELVVELMEHAVSHSEDADALGEFEAQMREFDVEAFVDRYRAERDFETEYDSAV
jgi:hypothetical protein